MASRRASSGICSQTLCRSHRLKVLPPVQMESPTSPFMVCFAASMVYPTNSRMWKQHFQVEQFDNCGGSHKINAPTAIHLFSGLLSNVTIPTWPCKRLPAQLGNKLRRWNLAYLCDASRVRSLSWAAHSPLLSLRFLWFTPLSDLLPREHLPQVLIPTNSQAIAAKVTYSITSQECRMLSWPLGDAPAEPGKWKATLLHA